MYAGMGDILGASITTRQYLYGVNMFAFQYRQCLARHNNAAQGRTPYMYRCIHIAPTIDKPVTGFLVQKTNIPSSGFRRLVPKKHLTRRLSNVGRSIPDTRNRACRQYFSATNISQPSSFQIALVHVDPSDAVIPCRHVWCGA